MPDEFEGFLCGVEQGRKGAIAPELLLAESVNVINEKRIAGELDSDENNQLLSDLFSVPENPVDPGVPGKAWSIL